MGSHLQDTGAFGRADLAMGLGTSGQVQGPGGNTLNVKMSPDGRVIRSKTADINSHKQMAHIRSDGSFRPGGGMPKLLGGSGAGKYETASRAGFEEMLEKGAFKPREDGNFFSATPKEGSRLESWGAKSYGDPGANMFGRTEGQSMLSWMNQQFNPFT